MTSRREKFLAQYAASHRHPVNRWCHFFGIPLIVSATPRLIGGYWQRPLLTAAAATFCCGWTLQFVGHGFEGQRPEFLNNWRFLFVGVRWWVRELRDRMRGGPAA